MRHLTSRRTKLDESIVFDLVSLVSAGRCVIFATDANRAHNHATGRNVAVPGQIYVYIYVRTVWQPVRPSARSSENVYAKV